jgi:hypothetical protein
MENVYSNEKSPKPTTNQNIMYIEEECDQESTTLTFHSSRCLLSRCVNLKREYECKQTWRRQTFSRGSHAKWKETKTEIITL